MTDNLILSGLQNIHEAIIKTKEEHTPNYRMIKPTEKLNFSEPILITTKLSLIKLSVYNSVLDIIMNINQFLFASTVLTTMVKPHLRLLVLTLTLTLTIIRTVALVQTLLLSLIIITKESHCYYQLLHQVHMN